MKFEQSAFKRDRLELTETDLQRLRDEGFLEAGALSITYKKYCRPLRSVAREFVSAIVTAGLIPEGSCHWKLFAEFRDSVNATTDEED